MISGFTVFIAAAVMMALGVLMSAVLDWASRRFKVEVDPRIEAVEAALPAANCGGCGYVGCGPYAKAVVNDGEDVTKCTVGGPATAEAVAGLMGVEVDASWPKRAVVHCGATFDDRGGVNTYIGEASCSAANVISGYQGCVYGCLGLGDCERSCEYDAIHASNGLAKVDYDKCVGCEACTHVCPRNIISMVPFKEERMLVVTCSNKDAGKDVKEVCTVGCIGCKGCTKNDAPLKMNALLPIVDYDSYTAEMEDDIDASIDKCPMSSLFYVGRIQERHFGDADGMETYEADFKSTVDDAEWRG